ncbi:MAG: class I SAM-dependent methyltransferase [Micavibrio sp.]|nr:class I SAM-dependent methyltransferase [Micavibrio sp.]
MTRSTEVAAQYEAIADWFDANRNKTLFEKPYLDRIAAEAPGKNLLDLGCGSGEPMAAFFIANGFTVTGMDISQRMVDMAQRRFPAHRFSIGDMRTADFGGQYDVMLAWDSFFHLTGDEQRAMIPKFGRHAAQNALLLFNTGPGEGTAYGTMEGHDIHHASLSAAEYKTLLETAGFKVIVHTVEDHACGGRTVWLAQRT